MEFGQIEESELLHTDFTLRHDSTVNTAVLANGKGNTKFYIGCAKWGRKDWIGKLYPKATKEKDFLAYYAKQFNCIEFNGFYYNLHSRGQVQKWAATVPDDFLFCPKFTEYITHIRRLKDVQREISEYYDVVTAFGKHLGPIFLMPHPQIGLKHRDTLEEFIYNLPIDVPVFLELRHKDWYKEADGYDNELYAFLREKKRGTVITDAAGRRDCVHMHLTIPECFIRFVGNGLHPTDYTRIDEWVQRIKIWMNSGLEKCYFFMHQHEELHSPELIKYFIEQMNMHCGTDIKLPIIYSEGLF